MGDDLAPLRRTLRQRLNRWKIIIVQSASAAFGGIYYFADEILSAIKSAGVDFNQYFSAKIAGLIVIGISLLTVSLKLFASDASPLKKDKEDDKDV